MKRRICRWLGAWIIMATGTVSATPVELWVAPDGSDEGAGTQSEPLASLAGTRDRLRKMEADDGATVWVRGGEYFLEETFVLEERDGGTEGAPVVYRVWEKEEVRLSGGRRIPAEAFRPVEGDTAAARVDAGVRAQVRVADLGALGLTAFGEVPEKYRGAAKLAELFFDDERMQLARWPNEGWAEVDEIVEQGSVPRQGETDGRPGSFRYAGERPERWVGREVWLHGYWCFDWYDEAIRVAEIDSAEKVVSFSAPHHYGVRNGNPPPRRWYATNVLEELDRPGEYYLDRRAGKLYFWPPGELEGARVVLSTLAEPIVKLDGVSHLTLRGFTVENGRGTGIAVEGGKGVEILACTVRNMGETGIDVEGGEGHRVEACNIHDTGTLGLVLRGGERRTLTPGGHRAVNNHIYRFAARGAASGERAGGERPRGRVQRGAPRDHGDGRLRGVLQGAESVLPGKRGALQLLAPHRPGGRAREQRGVLRRRGRGRRGLRECVLPGGRTGEGEYGNGLFARGARPADRKQHLRRVQAGYRRLAVERRPLGADARRGFVAGAAAAGGGYHRSIVSGKVPASEGFHEFTGGAADERDDAERGGDVRRVSVREFRGSGELGDGQGSGFCGYGEGELRAARGCGGLPGNSGV